MNDTVNLIPQFIAVCVSQVSTRAFNKLAKLFKETFNKELTMGMMGRIKVITEDYMTEKEKEKYYYFIYGYSLGKGFAVKPY